MSRRDEYDNTNKGAIWKNDDKRGERSPDFKGKLDVEGVEYIVTAWKRKPDAKPTAPSLRFSIIRKDELENMDAQTQGSQDRQGTLEVDDEFDDDIPF